MFSKEEKYVVQILHLKKQASFSIILAERRHSDCLCEKNVNFFSLNIEKFPIM